jgi:site-specific DNA-cytosine methylase
MDGMTLFTGFGGADLGMRAAGVNMVAGIEYDQAIAEVAHANGVPCDVVDILDSDPRRYLGIQALHASTVCTRASPANNSAKENEDGLREAALDMAMARKVIEYLEVLRPCLFTLENVWGYREFQSFKGGAKCEGIYPALRRLGYQASYWHLNAADYGVPQTRRRLILCAALGFRPQRPEATHYNPKDYALDQPMLFGEVRPWVGWYEAIEDLIPTLPESEFAPWQLERLPKEIRQSILVHCSDMRSTPVNEFDKPSFTILAHKFGSVRAFIVPGGNAGSFSVRAADEPARTIEDVNRVGNIPRALIFSQDYGSPNTVKERKLNTKDPGEPVFTIKAQDRPVRAWLSAGKVVKMTPRALARFQSIPDDYKLPDGPNPVDWIPWLPKHIALACKGIGNAIPPLLARRVWESLLKREADHA